MSLTFADIQTNLAPELKRLNDCINSVIMSPNTLMNSVVEYYLRRKGKQIRPIVVFLTAQLLGRVTDEVVRGAVAVELLHNATLIHDDVVDETKMRRDGHTINALWDNRIAVLVGDFFLSTSLQQGYATGHKRVIESLSNLGRDLSVGELDQIYNARHHVVDEEAYFDMITRKTASLFISCVEVGCYTAGATDEQVSLICEFARLLGLCFQIKDDVFDYFGDEHVGKPTGNDLREGKLTLPLIYALEREDAPGRGDMLELVGHETLSPEEIATLIAYARDNGGIDYAYEKMSALRDQAVAILENFPATPARESLVALLDYIIVRDH